MKHKILTLALILSIPFFITACTASDLPVIGKYFGGGVVTKNPLTLNVWGLWEAKSVMDIMIQKYQETNLDVTINYDDRSVLDLVEYKERVFARAMEEGGPDIMRVHVSWVPRMISMGLLNPMPSSVMDMTHFQESFYPVANDNLISDGKIYGLPIYYDGLVLVYNKAHFKEIGQTNPPTAWEEFRRLALELTVRGENNQLVRAGAAIGAADNIDFFSDILGMLFSQAGISIPSELDTKPAQDALTFYTNFVTEDQVWDKSMVEASTAFAQEKVSMIFIPSWKLLDILSARPDLDIGVAPVPQAVLENPATWGSFWVDVVPKASKNVQESWDFINFFVQKDQQIMLFNEGSKVRAFGTPYSLKSLGLEVSTNPYLKPLLDTAEYAKSFEMSAKSGNRRQVEVLRGVVNTVLGGSGTAERGLELVKEEFSK